MTDPIGKGRRLWQTDSGLVDSFAEKMYNKMRENKHKAHWNTVTQEWLIGRLEEEVRELIDAVNNGGDVISEAADVANFAAMIADNESQRA